MNTRLATARGRIVGAELRAWRERANLENAEVARRLSWSPTKVSNIESGRRRLSEVDAAMYLACCRAPGDDIRRVLEFFYAQSDLWVQPHNQLTDELRSLITLETTATAIHCFELAVVPGLLQTEDYARALITGRGLAPPEAIEPRVRARKDRQVLLRRLHPPRCVFFIHESAVRLPIGNHAIMNDQLLHLVFAAARPHIEIRVVLSAAGLHAGMGGPFTVLAGGGAKPVVYLENDVASLFLDGSEHVAHYRKNLKRLAAIALDEGQSRAWLAQLASDHDRPREDACDHDRVGGSLAQE